MTYKEAISLFRARYARNSKDTRDIMTDDEILAEMSVVQADLQNKHMLTQAEADVEITSASSVYTAGNGAGNIPIDILQIIKVWLDDNLQSVVSPISISYQKDYMKPTQQPYAYTLTMQNGSMEMELDSTPDKNYTLTMLYIPQYVVYGGSGGINTGTEWSDVDYDAVDYGGSLKLPLLWHSIVIDGALANSLNDPQRMIMFENRVKQALQSRPVEWSGQIPYDNSVEAGTAYRRILREGQDRPQRRRLL